MMKKLLIIGMAIIFLQGCASAGTKVGPDKISQIKEEMPKEEVIQILGKPDMVSLTSDAKEIMMYHHFKYQTKASTFIPVVGLLAGGGDMEQQVLQILINEEGKVEKFIFNDSASEINSGLLNTR